MSSFVVLGLVALFVYFVVVLCFCIGLIGLIKKKIQCGIFSHLNASQKFYNSNMPLIAQKSINC